MNRRRTRDPLQSGLIFRHCLATTIEAFGRQIWKGSMLMSQFIIANREIFFPGVCVMELGCGIGFVGTVLECVMPRDRLLTASDYDESLLRLTRDNMLMLGRHRHC